MSDFKIPFKNPLDPFHEGQGLKFQVPSLKFAVSKKELPRMNVNGNGGVRKCMCSNRTMFSICYDL
jgi:hypothetical protein